MKYGFRRVSAGQGGKVKVVYDTYWSIPKLFGLTYEQFMADSRFCSFPQSTPATSPQLPAFIGFHISDFNLNQVRLVSATAKITQMGRWEGQQADYS